MKCRIIRFPGTTTDRDRPCELILENKRLACPSLQWHGASVASARIDMFQSVREKTGLGLYRKLTGTATANKYRKTSSVRRVRWLSGTARQSGFDTSWDLDMSLDPLLHPSRKARANFIFGGMADQFFYVRFIFNPKIRDKSLALKAVAEVPKELVLRKRELVDSNATERGVALDLARRAVVAMLSMGAEPGVWPYDEDALWYTDVPNIINERPCDYEDGDIRVWRIL
jgi:hypothetical protein